jgi:hypothetical protein
VYDVISGAATLRYPPVPRREPCDAAGGDTDSVAEFRGSADEPDGPDRPGRDVPEAVGDSRPTRADVEPRSRAGYAAELEQKAVSGWDASGSRDADRHDRASEQVRRFQPGRAGLADISPAFAEAFARGVEHPRVRAALETPYDPDSKPYPVQLPLSELLA